ncbi:hypothetical protein ACOME3_009954 [Neoechinorhynchus agilis]
MGNEENDTHRSPRADLTPRAYSLDDRYSDTRNRVFGNVIVERDHNGFGLTLAGCYPAVVHAIRKDSGAERAGLKPGDWVIRVNGTFVADRTHCEVVKLIADTGGTFTALTISRITDHKRRSATSLISTHLCGVFANTSGHRRSTPSIHSIDRNMSQTQNTCRPNSAQSVYGPQQNNRDGQQRSQVCRPNILAYKVHIRPDSSLLT